MTKSETKIHLCNDCFQNFDDSSKLEKQSLECNTIIAEMTSNNNSILRFKNLKSQLDCSFVVYVVF